MAKYNIITALIPTAFPGFQNDPLRHFGACSTVVALVHSFVDVMQGFKWAFHGITEYNCTVFKTSKKQ